MTATDVKLTDETTLEIVRVLPGPIDRVWAFLTESDKRAKWLCGGEVELHEGGKIEMAFDHRRISKSPPPEKYKDQVQVSFECEVLVADPPNKLAFSWPDADGPDTEVTISLEPVGELVRLHPIHKKMSSGDHRVGAAAGWHGHLDILQSVLSGEPAPDFWPLHTSLEAKYAHLR